MYITSAIAADTYLGSHWRQLTLDIIGNGSLVYFVSKSAALCCWWLETFRECISKLRFVAVLFIYRNFNASFYVISLLCDLLTEIQELEVDEGAHFV